MKEYIGAAMIAAFLLSTGTGCVSEDKKVEVISPVMIPSKEEPPMVKKRTHPKEPLVRVKATVMAVDLSKRLLTLKDSAEKVFDVKLGEEVTGLAQIKVGDEVSARYYEWVMVEISKAMGGRRSPLTAAASNAEPGGEPAGVEREQITVIAEVEEIDHPWTHVTIRQQDGRSIKVFVRRPSSLREVKAGDQVLITYVEALAVSVEKTK